MFAGSRGPRLGAFALEAPLGRGGMGTVWRGVHVTQGVPVAIKVLTHDAAREQTYVDAFRQEVQAVAGLDHPNVVVVLDHGRIGREVAEAAAGKLAPGSPYLVMELAGGGALSALRGRLNWPHLRRVLLQLLDALAHAHARGIVHRDLKPGNVLLAGPATVKLTDFGLAHLFDVSVEGRRGTEVAAGTPRYTAPEQFEGRWRDYGPWTDLYALGCLAWALATGRAPYAASTWWEAHAAHTTRPLPPFVPRHEMPAGFADWLATLLRKAPEARFRRAADAAWALRRLERTSEAPADPGAATAPSAAVTLVWPTSARSEPAGPKGSTRLPRSMPLAQHGRPPLPPTWRRGATKPRPLPLLGAGLGLYGLRAIPLVGREAARDALWQALGTLERGPAARVLRGAAGMGKSRVAAWLCRRAHEVGAVSVLRAVHSATPSAVDGLSAMVARHLRCAGLERGVVRERVRLWAEARGCTEPDVWDSIVALVCPADAGEGAVRFRTVVERHLALRRFLALECRERPVLLWLDDVQWSLDALAFTRGMLRDESLPVLALLTVQEEALAQRAAERASLETLLAAPRVEALAVGALPAAEHRVLVAELLQLEGAAARQVEERTQGNPLFAVQLVGDWVQRGALEAGAQGFRLRAGVSAPLPDDLHAMWAQGIERLLGPRPGADGIALELAATLGTDVDGVEWAQACARSRVEAPTGLVDALVRRRLAVHASGPGQGWSFVHGMLRESVARRAQEAGRAADHHRVCAELLVARGDAESLQRRGRHLLAAGEVYAALDPLFQAAFAFAISGDLGRLAAAIEEREAAMVSISVPESDEAWGHGAYLVADMARVQGRHEEARARALRTVERARAHGWDRTLARSLLTLARVARHQDDPWAAEPLVTEAEEAARRAGDDSLVTRVAWDRGGVELGKGNYEAAVACYTEALDAMLAHGDLQQASVVALTLCNALRLGGRPVQARATLERALELGRRAGYRWAVGQGLGELGCIALASGDVDEAERHLLASVEALQQIESEAVAFPRLMLGVVAALRGDAATTRTWIERARPFFDRVQAPSTLAIMAAAEAAADALDGRWAKAGFAIARTERLVAGRRKEEDVARMANLVADRADAAGHPDLAERARVLALSQTGRTPPRQRPRS